MIIARITDFRTTDYIWFYLVGTRRTTGGGVATVLVINITVSICSSIGSGADYGLQDYGFVRVADWVRISRACGLQDYGLC